MKSAAGIVKLKVIKVNMEERFSLRFTVYGLQMISFIIEFIV